MEALLACVDNFFSLTVEEKDDLVHEEPNGLLAGVPNRNSLIPSTSPLFSSRGLCRSF
jgi:hypothetical protein